MRSVGRSLRLLSAATMIAGVLVVVAGAHAESPVTGTEGGNPENAHTGSGQAFFFVAVVEGLLLIAAMVLLAVTWSRCKRLQASVVEWHAKNDSERDARLSLLKEMDQASGASHDESPTSEDNYQDHKTRVLGQIRRLVETASKTAQDTRALREKASKAEADRAALKADLAAAQRLDQFSKNLPPEVRRKLEGPDGMRDLLEKVSDIEARERDLEVKSRQVKDREARLLSQEEDLRKWQVEIEKSRQAAAVLRQLEEQSWPDWIAKNSLKPSIDELGQMVSGGNVDALVLVAYLKLFGAIQDHPATSKDFNYSWACLREIGRFLAALVEGQGLSPEESAARMAEWAAAINSVAGDRFSVGVPKVGWPFNPSQMVAAKSDVQAVSRVLNWWVSNAKSITVSKAEVA
jgi:hypothetical protein